MTDTAASHPAASGQSVTAWANDNLDLMVYWRSITRRKWQILGLAVAMTLAALAVVMMMTPIYRATVTVLIEQNKAKAVSIEEVYSGISNSREHFQTQAEILKSKTIAEKVIKRLKLDTNPEFDPRQQEKSWLAKTLLSMGIGSDEPPTEEAVLKSITGAFSTRMSVEPIRLSQLVKVSFESRDPQLAAKVANAIADVYIENDMDARYQMTKKATDWLNGQMAELKQNLAKSEQTLQAYRDQNRIIDTQGLAQAGFSKQIEDLTQGLVAARSARAQAENAYKQLAGAKDSLDSLPVVQRNPLVSRLKEVEAEAAKKVAEMSNRYGKEHPKMIQAESEYRQARESTRRQIDAVVSSLQKDYEVAQANERAVSSTLGEAKGSIQHLNRKEFQLSSLQREVATNQQIYDMFLSRFKEMSASNDNQTSVIARVVDPALAPEQPVKPKRSLILAITLMMGLFLGAMIALLLERLDNTVKTSEEVEARLGQPMLTMLPHLTGDQAKNAGRQYLLEPKSIFSEGIRTARTGVLLSNIDATHRVLVVTSSVPGEGKSTVAINLAMALAQTKKVLLLDADMRRPSLTKTLDLDVSRPGLSDLTTGASKVAECIHHLEGTPLHVIGSGSIPPNPLDLLHSHRFQEALAHLGALYDILIIDSPPVQLVSDALVLAAHSTGVIYVVKADETPYQIARKGIRALVTADAPLIGVALNQLDFKKADRYYGAYTGYSKYGYENYYGATT